MGDVAAAALAPEGFLAGALDGGGWLASQLATKNSTFVRVLDAACSPGPSCRVHRPQLPSVFAAPTDTRAPPPPFTLVTRGRT